MIMEPLSDSELEALLPEWKTPAAPARLRGALFPELARPWWTRLWTASIRIPVPVAVCALILLAAVLWRWPARVVPADRRIEVQPVAELQPKIIRRGHVPN